jgi:hypothetical protein
MLSMRNHGIDAQTEKQQKMELCWASFSRGIGCGVRRHAALGTVPLQTAKCEVEQFSVAFE